MGRSAPSTLLSPHLASALQHSQSLLPQTRDAITWHEVAQSPPFLRLHRVVTSLGSGNKPAPGDPRRRNVAPPLAHARRSQRLLTQRWEPAPHAAPRAGITLPGLPAARLPNLATALRLTNSCTT